MTSYLDEAERLGVRSFDLYFYRGMNHYYLAHDIEAISDFEKAIEIKPKYAEAYFYMGVCQNSILTRSGCDAVKKGVDLGFEEGKKSYAEECLN